MPVDFSTLRNRERQRAAAYLQSRSKVIAAIDEIYNRVEIYSSAQIDPASYKFLGINCQSLKLDDDGKHLHPLNSDPSAHPSALTFFEPRGAAWVAPVRVTDAKRKEELRQITDKWDSAKDNPLVQRLHSQALYVFSRLERMFFLFRREFYPEGDGRVPPNLRQMSKWVKSGTIVPSVFADKFYSTIWGSMRWSPVAAFVAKKPLDNLAAPPHILIIIMIEEDPREGLFRGEVMILTAAMVTRLKGEESLEYNTIPVMAITIFGRMKARVIEAHSSQQGIVIKKTQLFDFSTNQVANKNMDILLGFMAGDLVGDPREPTVPTNTQENSPNPEKVDKAKGRNPSKDVPENTLAGWARYRFIPCRGS